MYLQFQLEYGFFFIFYLYSVPQTTPHSYTPKLISKERMCNAVDVILSLQNPNGGFASYEPIRGPAWLELLNPAEVFGLLPISFFKLLAHVQCS